MGFNSVQLVQENDQWVVVIVESGEETRRTFDIEAHARSWADGQRIRLGLSPLGRDVSD